MLTLKATSSYKSFPISLFYGLFQVIRATLGVMIGSCVFLIARVVQGDSPSKAVDEDSNEISDKRCLNESLDEKLRLAQSENDRALVEEQCRIQAVGNDLDLLNDNEIVAIKSSLSEKEATLQKLTLDCQGLNDDVKEKGDLSKQICSFNEEIQNLKISFENTIREKNGKIEQMQNLQQSGLKELRDILGKSEEERNLIEEKLKEKEALLHESQTKCDQIGISLKSMTAQLEESIQKLSDEKKLADKLVSEKEDLIKESSDKYAQFEQKQKQDREEAEKKLKELQQKLTEAEEKYKNEKGKLESEFVDMRKEKDSLKERLSASEMDLMNTKKRLEETQEALRQSEASPAQSANDKPGTQSITSSTSNNEKEPKEKQEPTVVAAAHFNAEKDSQTLRDAMKGLGTDEDTIIEVLCSRDYKQIDDIQKTYQQMFGRILFDDLKSNLGGKLKKVVLNLLRSPALQNAHTLRNAVKGAGTDETAIIEIMCTSTNEELAEIKEIYRKEFKSDLTKDLVDDTSGDFKRFLVSMTSGDRDQNGNDLNDHEAKELAQRLFDAGKGRAGTDEEAFNVVFGLRGFHQLRSVFRVYKREFQQDIYEVINKEFSGSIKEAYLAIATTAMEGREEYLAGQLYRSMKGVGTNDKQLIRLMTSRSQVDLKGIKTQFLRKYGKTLEEFIADDTSGDYEKCLLALAKGNLQ